MRRAALGQYGKPVTGRHRGAERGGASLQVHTRLSDATIIRMVISKDQERRLRELVAAFLAENQKINLSAYREEEQCWVGNILDSIEGIGGNEFGDGMRVLDLGTGGGFPLLPLAILFPNVSFTGLDATKKKIEAVRRIANHLNLTNVDLLIGRAEELGREVHLREQFDAVLSRAVAPLATLLEFMSPFVRVGGRIFCYKSLTIEEEVLQSIQARMQLKTRLTDRRIYSLDEAVERGGLPAVAQLDVDIARLRATRYGGQPPLRGGWGRRQLLIFQKTAALTNEFPREVGIPKKMPL